MKFELDTEIEENSIFRSGTKYDKLVKSRKAPVVVIPAKAGIQ